MLAELTLYTKTDCELCEPFKKVVMSVMGSRLFKKHTALTCIDIDANPEAYTRYSEKIPVLEINGRLAFKYRVTARELELALSRALARPLTTT